MQADSDPWFAPVPLAVGGRGGYARDHLCRALLTWAASPPLRALAAASGWTWPDGPDALAVLGALAELSADWDFRASRERSLVERAPALVNGRPVPDALVAGAARALGLVDSAPVSDRAYSHLVILGGRARACVNRAHHAAELLRGGVRAESVIALGAHRRLAGAEREQAAEAGLGDLDDEADVILAATTRALGLGAPVTSEMTRRPGSGPHGAAARYQWPSAEVVIAPSDMPESRRAKTGDQLRYWAGQAGLGAGHDVLVVTNQIYVPYQHLVACRVLGRERGCGVYTSGVDARSALLAGPPFAGRAYLQEIRAALRAARALLEAAPG